MAHPNFEEWLVDFLQKSCGFSPEDAVGIKDEIIKNIEWYNQNTHQDALKKALDQLAEIQKRGSAPLVPLVPLPPWSQPWKDNTPYIGDPMPGQEPITYSDTSTDFPVQKYYSFYKNFNEKLSKRKDDTPDH